MGTKTSIGLGLALLLMVLAVVLRFGIADQSKIEAAQKAAEEGAMMKKNDSSKMPEKLQGSDNDMGHTHPSSDQHVDDIQVRNTTHLDQLSPEMKQSLRDQLILHGPRDTFEKSDGTVVLPAQGRSTQISVAVQMPDGSIQVREYTEIPDDQETSPKVYQPTVKFVLPN